MVSSLFFSASVDCHRLASREEIYVDGTDRGVAKDAEENGERRAGGDDVSDLETVRDWRSSCCRSIFFGV